jgi:hypothetical protein
METYPDIEYIKNPVKFHNQEAVEVIIKPVNFEEEFPTVISRNDSRFPNLYDEILAGEFGEVTYEKPPTEQELIEANIEILRRIRAELFALYIDRSQLWYNSLSELQKSELQAWYQVWLNMPETVRNGTWVEPILPEWLK